MKPILCGKFLKSPSFTSASHTSMRLFDFARFIPESHHCGSETQQFSGRSKPINSIRFGDKNGFTLFIADRTVWLKAENSITNFSGTPRARISPSYLFTAIFNLSKSNF